MEVKCAKSYEMCGGTNYPDAPNCCEPGNFCWKKYSNLYQCLPDSLKDVMGYVPSEDEKPNNCAKANEPCGGSYYKDAPNCCEPGYACVYRSSFYSVCQPESENINSTLTTTVTTTTTTNISIISIISIFILTRNITNFFF